MSPIVLPPSRQHTMILSTSETCSAGSPADPRLPPSPETARTTRQRDAAHVRRFLAGDESAFAEMMALHHGKIYAIAVSVLRNRSDAEEIVQDTFVRAHRGLANFRGDSSLATWLHHIAYNLARNRYWYFFRRRRQDSRSLEAPAGEEGEATFAGLIADAAPDPARAAAQREFLSLVGTAMRGLPPCQQEILTLRNLLDLSYDDIGSRLGINLGTVKSRIARARRNLRSLLADAYPGRRGDCAQWFETRRAAGQLVVATS
jgi:RNA polymerase sigma-70 factor (ECF subfamily)